MLMACSNLEQVVEEKAPVDGQSIKVNFVIKRADFTGDTKATVKTAWAENDVVFLFVKDQAADAANYIELKRISGTWTAIVKGSPALSASGKMTAVYLPYGSDYEVAASEGNYTFKKADEDYCGHFYICQNLDYTYETETLYGDITLIAAKPTNGDLLVHFDVSGYTTGHSYNMYQDYMKPMSLTGIAPDGTVSTATGSMGDAIPGFEDASFISFSGVLDASVKDTEVDYWFSIRDTDTGMLYFRDAGSKTVSKNMYIGMGSIAASPWAVATPGAFPVSDTKQITFARSNLSYLGATGGSKPWQLMKYPWSRIEVSGTFTPSATVDFSLFAWATSGYNPFGLEGGNDPWRNEAFTSAYDGVAAKFGPRINGNHPGVEWSYVNTENPEDANAQGGSIQWDWARKDGNDIYEYGGGNAIIGYRTPTKDEYVYIIDTRTDDYRYAKACVAGVNGLIIFPQGFNPGSSVTINSKNTDNVSFGTNVLTDIVWNKIEAMGAVFLPCAGYLNPSNHSIVNYNSYAGYWTSTIGDSAYSWNCRIEHNISGTSVVQANGTLRALGMSVRLVHDL